MTVVELLGRLGRSAFGFVGNAGRFIVFTATTLGRVVRPPFRPVLTLSQIEFIGARSMVVVGLSAVFTGLVLTLQGYNVLVRFGSDNMVGSLVALSLTRELAPVLTALMVTARAASAMAATIGGMAVTEQIDALRSLSVDPVQHLVVPRFLASMVVLPILTALFSLVGIGAAYVFCVLALGLDGNAFMSNIRSSVEWVDVSTGLWKALLFGALMALVATFRGLQTRGGAQGVGQATSRTVVECAVLILSGDYVVTALFS